MKHGGKRKNAGRKSSWNSTGKSTTIRVPENLAESLNLAKGLFSALISVIDDFSNNIQ